MKEEYKKLINIMNEDEYIIAYNEYHNQNLLFIAYSNYNYIYEGRMDYNVSKYAINNIKLTKPFIFLVKNIFSQIIKVKNNGLDIYNQDYENMNEISRNIRQQLLCLPTIIYEPVEKYFGIDKFGVVGIDKIINQFNQLKNDNDKLKVDLEKYQNINNNLEDENNKIKKLLENINLQTIQIKNDKLKKN